MQHGLWIRNGEAADTARLVDLGVAAEDGGWDGVFVSDSLPAAQYPDPWVALAGIAAQTTDVTLGTWVVPIPRHQPWEVAMAVASLDQLSDGRMLLGTGLGNATEYDAFGRSSDPPALGERLDESLDVVTGLWKGEPFSYEGNVFALDEATVQPTPVQQPRVPILSACYWPNEKPFHRGARWDGIMPWWPSMTGDGVGPRGEEATGTAVEELRDSLEFYHDITDDPGEIVVPTGPADDGSEWLDVATEQGATWLLTTELDPEAAEAMDRVRRGPPA